MRRREVRRFQFGRCSGDDAECGRPRPQRCSPAGQCSFYHADVGRYTLLRPRRAHSDEGESGVNAARRSGFREQAAIRKIKCRRRMRRSAEPPLRFGQHRRCDIFVEQPAPNDKAPSGATWFGNHSVAGLGDESCAEDAAPGGAGEIFGLGATKMPRLRRWGRADLKRLERLAP